MANELIGYTITLKNGKELSKEYQWGTCTGLFQAAALSDHHFDELRESEAVEIEVEFEDNIRVNDVFMRMIKLLLPTVEIKGNTFSATIEGIAFDHVVCAIRLARYENSIGYPDGSLEDWPNLLGPSKAQLVDEKSSKFDKWSFGETLGHFNSGRKLCNFQEIDGFAALISFTSKKRTRINKGLLPPLGGPNGCLGYYKDYEFFDAILREKKDPMYSYCKPYKRDALLANLESIVKNMDDNAVPSVDWCIMGYGKDAYDHAVEKCKTLSKAGMDKYIKSRMDNDAVIGYEEDEEDEDYD